MPKTPRDLIGWSRPRSRQRRALAAGTWAAPRSGETYGFIDLDVTEAEAWCAGQAGVTLTHLIGAAVAQAVKAVPDANARVVLGRVRRREQVDVSYVVDVGNGADLAAVCVRNADRKSPRDVAREVLAGARALRRGQDHQFGRIRLLAQLLPPVIRRQVFAAGGFVTSGLGVGVRPAGVSAFPFGAVMISSIGSFGLERGLAPLVPVAKASLILVVGAPSSRPRVVGGEVVPRRVLELGMTMDHRILDGAQVADLAARLRQTIEAPWTAWADEGSAS